MVQMAVSPLPQWFEGSEYTHKVAACIMKYGPISRITLAQILGLSQGAVSRITSDLIYAGVIEETPMPSGKAGKLPKGFVQKENTERRGRPPNRIAGDCECAIFRWHENQRDAYFGSCGQRNRADHHRMP